MAFPPGKEEPLLKKKNCFKVSRPGKGEPRPKSNLFNGIPAREGGTPAQIFFFFGIPARERGTPARKKIFYGIPSREG